jgi:hypothetical protein
MPEYLELPLLFFGFGLLYSHFQYLKKEKIENYHWLGFLMFLFMYIGLAVHVVISISLTGLGTSGGWYLHILMPLLAPAIGLASFRFIQTHLNKIIFFVLLLYSFLFQLSAILSHAALFGAGAFKGTNKLFVFNQNILTLDIISKIYKNLSVICFPNLSFASFFLGFFILGYLIIKTQSYNKEYLPD